jgi:hypothetical protein
MVQRARISPLPVRGAIVSISPKETTLDGKRIAYTTETVFQVETAKGKGRYRVRYSIRGDLGCAVLWYNAINIAAPYRKRLRMLEANKQTLARAVG